MKKIHIIFMFLVGMAVVSSCTKNFEDFNTDKKRPTEVPGNFLFANAQVAYANQYSSSNVNLNNWKLWAEYWTETTYTDESNYDVVTRNIGNSLFRAYYVDMLNDLNQAKIVLTEEVVDGDVAKAEKANKLLIIDLMEVTIYHEMISLFGNIPYSQALDIENPTPVYDDAYTIFKDLITRVQNDVSNLNPAYGSFGTDDLMMGGDVTMWFKYGNSLLVKMGMLIANSDETLSKSVVEGAYAGAFGYGERCTFNYPGGANSNPLFQDLVQSGRHDFVPANTIVDMMNNLEDPRRPAYFTIYNDSAYIGGDYGYSNPFSQLSHIADRIQADNYGSVLSDYSDLAFYLAEAVERGYNVTGTAEEWYNSGIRSSMEYWGVASADVDTYLARPDVAYASATGDWKQKIATQSWLTYYVRGLEGWTVYRRLGYPVMNLPPSPEQSANGEVPRRMTYPINEQTLNPSNYASAASAVGGDNLSTKLFWDK